jgi:hypothetical protein
VRFVLVHGGSHGAWYWSRAIPELENLGHAAGSARWSLGPRPLIAYGRNGNDSGAGGAVVQAAPQAIGEHRRVDNDRQGGREE